MSSRLRFGGFELDRKALELRDPNGALVPLQPRVFDLLLHLIDHRDRVVGKEELVEALWAGAFITDEALTQSVRRLRVALGDDAGAPRFIETAARRGYRFVATIEAAAVVPSEAGRQRRRWAPVVAGLLLVGALVWSTRPPRPGLELTNLRRLTASAARELDPTISVDGQRIAFVRNDGRDGGLDLHLMDVISHHDDVVVRTSTDEWAPQLAPDGRSLVFLRLESGGRTDLILRDLGTGVERVIADAVDSMRWSPNGDLLALVRSGSLAARIEVVDLTGRSERVITVASAPRALAWLGSAAVAVALEDSIEIHSRDATPPRRITFGGLEPRGLASDQGTRLYAELGPPDGPGRWHRVDDGTPVLLGSVPAGGRSLAVGRRHVVFAREHKTRQLWAVTGTAAPIALQVPTTIEGFDIAPAGDLLVFTDWDPPPHRTEIRTVGLGIPPAAEVDLGDGLCPSFARDGSVVALSAGPNRRLELIVPTTGSRRTLATETNPAGRSDRDLLRCPAVSPDGATIVWPAILPAGSGLAMVSRDGGPITQLAPGSFSPPSWSPDGRRLASCGPDPLRATLVIFEPGSGRRLETGISCPFRVGPLWADDSTLWLVEHSRTSPSLIRWSLDGRELERRALGIPTDSSFWGLFDLRSDRHGTFYALTERYEADLWIGELE